MTSETTSRSVDVLAAALDKATRERDDLIELIQSSAPLSWAAGADMKSAYDWERTVTERIKQIANPAYLGAMAARGVPQGPPPATHVPAFIRLVEAALQAKKPPRWWYEENAVQLYALMLTETNKLFELLVPTSEATAEAVQAQAVEVGTFVAMIFDREGT